MNGADICCCTKTSFSVLDWKLNPQNTPSLPPILEKVSNWTSKNCNFYYNCGDVYFGGVIGWNFFERIHKYNSLWWRGHSFHALSEYYQQYIFKVILYSICHTETTCLPPPESYFPCINSFETKKLKKPSSLSSPLFKLPFEQVELLIVFCLLDQDGPNVYRVFWTNGVNFFSSLIIGIRAENNIVWPSGWVRWAKIFLFNFIRKIL